MSSVEQLAAESKSEDQDLRERCFAAISRVSILAQASVMSEILPEAQQFISPDARQKLSDWRHEHKDLIEAAITEHATSWNITIYELKQTSPPLEAIERFEACYDKALEGIAALGE